jgi:hypothetical protein
VADTNGAHIEATFLHRHCVQYAIETLLEIKPDRIAEALERIADVLEEMNGGQDYEHH